MLHYFAMSFFAPVLVSPRVLPSDEIDVYLINDRFVPIPDGKITVEFYNWSSPAPISTKQFSATAQPLSASLQNNVIISFMDYRKEEVFVKLTLQASGVTSPPNYIFPVPFKSVVGLRKPSIQVSFIG